MIMDDNPRPFSALLEEIRKACAPLFFLTAQLAAGSERPILTPGLEARELNQRVLMRAVDKLERASLYIEKLVRPRMGWVTTGRFSRLMAALSVLMAAAIAVPIPLTNTVPSFGLVVFALGLMMRDGVAVLGGVALGRVWIILLLMGFIIFGTAGVEWIQGS